MGTAGEGGDQSLHQPVGVSQCSTRPVDIIIILCYSMETLKVHRLHQRFDSTLALCAIIGSIIVE